MDYEKKYKEALEKARQLCAYPTSRPFISDLQELFPELKESEDEDEKIRKRIIHALHGDVLDMEETTKAIAWLEKQGEQKPADNAEPKLTDGFGLSNLRLSITQIQAIENYVKRYVEFVNS